MIISAKESLVDKSLHFNGNNELYNKYNQIRLLEPLITKDLSEITSNSGTELIGLNYSVKTASSIKDKIERSNIVPSELQSMKDIIRYTQICRHEDIVNQTKRTIADLETKGYKLSGITNYYKNPYPKTNYKGMHLNFISPQGPIFELQIHSNESFEVKQKGHELYEIIRSVSTPVEVKDKLLPKLQELHKSVPDPPGYESINNFTFKESKKYIESLPKVHKEITYIRNSDNSEGFLYDFTKDGKSIIKGIECTMSDGSVMTARCIDNVTETMYLTKNAKVSSIDSCEKDIISSIDARRLRDIIKLTEEQHKNWMQTNIEDVNKSDIWQKLYEKTLDKIKEGFPKYVKESQNADMQSRFLDAAINISLSFADMAVYGKYDTTNYTEQELITNRKLLKAANVRIPRNLEDKLTEKEISSIITGQKDIKRKESIGIDER